MLQEYNTTNKINTINEVLQDCSDGISHSESFTILPLPILSKVLPKSCKMRYENKTDTLLTHSAAFVISTDFILLPIPGFLHQTSLE
jgi:hypothetical protein